MDGSPHGAPEPTLQRYQVDNKCFLADNQKEQRDSNSQQVTDSSDSDVISKIVKEISPSTQP